jgi:hypothetical protein
MRMRSKFTSEKGFLRVTLCDLCVSVVKILRKNQPQRHRDRTENHGDGLFSIGVAHWRMTTSNWRSTLRIVYPAQSHVK